MIHLCMYSLFIILSFYDSIYLWFCLSMYSLSKILSIYVSAYLWFCLSMILSIYDSTYLWFYLSMILSIYDSVYLWFCLSIILSIYDSVFILPIYDSFYQMSIYDSVSISGCLVIQINKQSWTNTRKFILEKWILENIYKIKTKTMQILYKDNIGFLSISFMR